MVTYTAAFGYQNVNLTADKKDSILAKNETLGTKNFTLDCVTGYVTANDHGTKFKNMQIAGKNLAKKDDTVKVADQDIFDAGRYGHVWTSKGSVITDVFYDDSSARPPSYASSCERQPGPPRRLASPTMLLIWPRKAT